MQKIMDREREREKKKNELTELSASNPGAEKNRWRTVVPDAAPSVEFRSCPVASVASILGPQCTLIEVPSKSPVDAQPGTLYTNLARGKSSADQTKRDRPDWANVRIESARLVQCAEQPERSCHSSR
jgi:hypothetical protein